MVSGPAANATGIVAFAAASYTSESPPCPQVAIKRIPDVLASPDQAKRVLREVAILRRLAHPNVISLRDAFTRPAATGALRPATSKHAKQSALAFARGGSVACAYLHP